MIVNLKVYGELLVRIYDKLSKIEETERYFIIQTKSLEGIFLDFITTRQRGTIHALESTQYKLYNNYKIGKFAADDISSKINRLRLDYWIDIKRNPINSIFLKRKPDKYYYSFLFNVVQIYFFVLWIYANHNDYFKGDCEFDEAINEINNYLRGSFHKKQKNDIIDIKGFFSKEQDVYQLFKQVFDTNTVYAINIHQNHNLIDAANKIKKGYRSCIKNKKFNPKSVIKMNRASILQFYRANQTCCVNGALAQIGLNSNQALPHDIVKFLCSSSLSGDMITIITRLKNYFTFIEVRTDGYENNEIKIRKFLDQIEIILPKISYEWLDKRVIGLFHSYYSLSPHAELYFKQQGEYFCTFNLELTGVKYHKLENDEKNRIRPLNSSVKNRLYIVLDGSHYLNPKMDLLVFKKTGTVIYKPNLGLDNISQIPKQWLEKTITSIHNYVIEPKNLSYKTTNMFFESSPQIIKALYVYIAMEKHDRTESTFINKSLYGKKNKVFYDIIIPCYNRFIKDVNIKKYILKSFYNQYNTISKYIDDTTEINIFICGYSLNSNYSFTVNNTMLLECIIGSETNVFLTSAEIIDICTNIFSQRKNITSINNQVKLIRESMGFIPEHAHHKPVSLCEIIGMGIYKNYINCIVSGFHLHKNSGLEIKFDNTKWFELYDTSNPITNSKILANIGDTIFCLLLLMTRDNEKIMELCMSYMKSTTLDMNNRTSIFIKQLKQHQNLIKNERINFLINQALKIIEKQY